MISFLKPKAKPSRLMFTSKLPTGEEYQTVAYINARGELTGLSTIGDKMEVASNVNRCIDSAFTKPTTRAMEYIRMLLCTLFGIETNQVTAKTLEAV